MESNFGGSQLRENVTFDATYGLFVGTVRKTTAIREQFYDLASKISRSIWKSGKNFENFIFLQLFVQRGNAFTVVKERQKLEKMNWVAY